MISKISETKIRENKILDPAPVVIVGSNILSSVGLWRGTRIGTGTGTGTRTWTGTGTAPSMPSNLCLTCGWPNYICIWVLTEAMLPKPRLRNASCSNGSAVPCRGRSELRQGSYTLHGVLLVVIVGWRAAVGHCTACQEAGDAQRTHAVADVLHREFVDDNSAFSSSERLRAWRLARVNHVPLTHDQRAACHGWRIDFALVGRQGFPAISSLY